MEGLAGRWSLHKCAHLAASPGEHGLWAESAKGGWLRNAWLEDGGHFLFSSPRLPWCCCLSTPCPLRAALLGTLGSMRCGVLGPGTKAGILEPSAVVGPRLCGGLSAASQPPGASLHSQKSFCNTLAWQPEQTASLAALAGGPQKRTPALGRRQEKWQGQP